MAKIEVRFQCGCGFKTKDLAEAVIHSDKLSHSLDALGTITKDQKK